MQRRHFSFGAFLIAALCFSPPLFADSAALERGKVVKRTYDFKEAGKPLDYALYVPTQYDGKEHVPLVVLLHGLGSTPQQVMAYEGVTEQAEKHGMIVVAPFGYNTSGWYGAQGQGNRFRVGRVPADAPNNLGELSE